MPKPDKKHHGHSIEKFEDKMWERAVVAAGMTRSDPIAIQPTQHVITLGKVFDADDDPIQGKHKPHFRIEETDTEAVIVTSKPVSENTTFLERRAKTAQRRGYRRAAVTPTVVGLRPHRHFWPRTPAKRSLVRSSRRAVVPHYAMMISRALLNTRSAGVLNSALAEREYL